MAKRGRPSKYEARFEQEAFRLAMLGLTDKDLAAFFEVSERTIGHWKRDHPEFLAALKKGREPADGQVAVSLYRRATGYSHPDVDIRVVGNQVVQTPITKHYPPDTLACIYWLKNRQRDRWYDTKPRDHERAPEDVVNEAEQLRAALLAMEELDRRPPPQDDALPELDADAGD